MIDPSQLIASTEAVYGSLHMAGTYGRILPVPRERVIESTHESVIRLNGRELIFYDTPGHARHHVCVFDTKSRHVFAGDTFGLSYREFDDGKRQFIFPTSSPTQFDPAAEHRSLDLITGLRPSAIYLTHYSQVRDIARLADDMHRLVTAHEELGRAVGDSGSERHARLKAGITEMILREAARYAWPVSRERALEIFAGDIELNAQGLAIWIDASTP
jgi:hydroxyacylglutathione hydrolase